MKFKRIMSLGLISALIAGTINIPVIAEDASGTDVKNYNDYVKGEMPASLLKGPIKEDGTYRAGERGWYSASRNNDNVNTDPDFDAKDGWGAADSYSPRSLKTFAAIEVLDGIAGATYISWNKAGTVSYFQMDNTKNYVLKMDIKDNKPDETAPKLNFCVWNENVQSRAWSKEYGAEGFTVTGEYKTYAGTFDLPDSFDNTTTNAITAGFMAPVAAGESISFDTSAPGKVYFAEEVAYDIKNEKTSEDKGLFAGDSATFEAQILNQIGSEGYLDQNVEWLVLDESRSEIISGFTVETDESTKKATVTVGDAVQTGTYVVVAYSEKYDMAMGQEIKVYEDNSYVDHIPGDLNDNLLGHYDISPEREFFNKGTRHNTSINDDTAVQIKDSAHWSNETSTYLTRAMKVESTLNIPGTGVAGLSFAPWRPNNDPTKATTWFQFDKSKNYVFKIDLKDNYPDETPVRMNFSISNETERTRTWSKEYGENGFYLTGDYKTYGGTFKIHENFNPDSTNSISVGFLAGNAVGESFSVDTSKRNIYFAEEKVYDIKVENVSEEPTTDVNPAIIEATVVNQIGSSGYLNQNFVWRVKTLGGEDVTDSMTITPIDGTKKVSIAPDPGVEKVTYKAYALSSDYGICKSVEFRVEAEKYNVYVDGTNGNDENSGNIDAPVKTIAKAIELVRTLKIENNDKIYQYIINVADGEYYFSKSQNLTDADSGYDRAPTVIKAINPGKVSFTGAVEIDTSNAKKVTDKAILSRMYESVRDKVYEIDLLENGFPYSLADERKHASGSGSMLYSIEYPEIYLDGKEQMIAQWPNGEGQYSNYDRFVDSVSFVSKYDDYSRWTTAKDMWIAGYYVTDYGYRRLYVDSVDADSNVITMEDTGVSSDYMGVVTNLSKRYKAMNLLEEIDVPGEWYIDRDTMKLYYYAPDDIKDRTLEITALKQRMFILNNTDNFKFSGIKFEKTRDEVIYMTDVSGIEILDCEFRDALATAIFSTSTKDAMTDKNYWQRQKIDGANNCLIENCLFENIGAVAIDLTGGNVDTLEKSGNIIRNNIFHRIAQKTRYSAAVKLLGCGNVFEYNNISSCPTTGVTSMGNDHIIRYNEIYDVGQETDDCGAIYQGRSALQRGVEIAYNYLHNLNSIEELPFKHQNGIYWDDSQGGHWAHDNIIKDVRIDAYNAGVESKFENNISVNVPKVLYFKNGSVPTHSEDKNITTFQGYIEYPEIYYGKYKNLRYIIENFGDQNLAKLTEVKGNLALNSKEVALENLVTASGNVQTDNEDIFIGEDEHDFRISKATQKELGISNNLNEDFSMDWIGVQSDFKVSAKDFDLNYPKQDEIIVDGSRVYFNWDYMDGANWYELIVATDSSFTNHVVKKDLAYNHYSIPLEDGEYYWKVVARNTSREFAFEKASAIETFTVGEDYKLTDFTESAGAIIRTITGKLTYNGDKDSISQYVYVAVYDGENNLKNVRKDLYNFKKGVPTDISCKLIANATDLYVRMFVWTENQIAEILPKTLVIVE